MQFSYRKYCSLEHDGVTDSIPGLGYEVILLDGKSSGLPTKSRSTNGLSEEGWLPSITHSELLRRVYGSPEYAPTKDVISEEGSLTSITHSELLHRICGSPD